MKKAHLKDLLHLTLIQKRVTTLRFLGIQYTHSNIKVTLMSQDKFEQSELTEFKSKTQIKNEMHELQKLGVKLVELSSADLNKIPLNDELLDAINLARRINKKKEGYRRQLQFIGKLIRSTDLTPIESALRKVQLRHQGQNEAFHKVEKVRDDILNQGDAFIHELCLSHEHLDMQKLRQLLRQANKEKKNEKPPKAAREMFKYLKSHIEE